MGKDRFFSKVISNEKIVNFLLTLLVKESQRFFSTSFLQINHVRLFSLVQSGGYGWIYHCGQPKLSNPNPDLTVITTLCFWIVF